MFLVAGSFQDTQTLRVMFSHLEQMGPAPSERFLVNILDSEMIFGKIE